MSGSDALRHRLAAILVADAVGYSRLMAANERATVAALDAARSVFRRQIEASQGRVIDMAGDSVLAVFELATGAVSAALAIQRELNVSAQALSSDQRMLYRIGVHTGEIIEKSDGTVYGDGVNIAARLEGLAEPGTIAVSDTVRAYVRGKVAAEFEDLGEQSVKNIAEPVRAYCLRATPEVDLSTAMARSTSSPPLSEKPSVAVLPFTNMSGDSEQDYFADGITDEITTALSCLRWLFVIARNSMFTFKGQAVDVRHLGKDLHVRYVVEGSVRRSADRVRISAQLSDCQTGRQIWSDRYDRMMVDAFDLQDEIARNVAAAIEPALFQSESVQAASKPSGDRNSWDYYLRAMDLYYRETRADNDVAQDLAEKATELDPSSARAFCALAACRYRAAVNGWCESRGKTMSSALDAAQKAVALDEADAQSHHRLGLLMFAYGRHESALSELERALELNPSLAWAYAAKAAVLSYSGEPKKALENFDMAVKASPRDPDYSYWQCAKSLTYFMLGEFQKAVDCASYSIAHHAEWLPSRVFITATYGLSGQLDKAREALSNLLTLEPGYSIKKAKIGNPFKRAEDFERFANGLRAAGVQDE